MQVSKSKLKHMKKIFLFLLTVLFLTSCDPGCEYSYFVKNNSNYNITVKYLNLDKEESLIVVTSNTNIQIYNYGDLGLAEDMNESFLRCLDTVEMWAKDTLEIKKDIYLRENWNFEITDGEYRFGDGGVGNYTFEISNENIE